MNILLYDQTNGKSPDTNALRRWKAANMNDEVVVNIEYVGFLGESAKKESEFLTVPSDPEEAKRAIRKYVKSKFGIDQNYLISITDRDHRSAADIKRFDNSVVVKIVPVLSGG
jgi:hypothetical protein